MNSISMAFLLTSLAGLSTMLGCIPILINIRNENKIIAGSLSFAAGVMICVSVIDLVPESISMLEELYNGIITVLLSFSFIMVGMITSSLIDNKLTIEKNTSLYKVGIISMIAIILHNVPEGIATFISTTKDTSLGVSLSIAIAMHNIPEGISISVPIYYATKSKSKALIYTFISGLSETMGAILTYLFLLPFINETILGLLFSLIAGIMLHISFVELLPTSVSYKENNITKIFFIIGLFFMFLKLFI